MVAVPRKAHTFGSRFSRDVHRILAKPREAVKIIIAESDLPHSLSVPLFVVIVAAIMGVIGEFLASDIALTISGAPIWQQAIISVLSGMALTIKLFVMPFALIIIWIFWSIVFHFLGSIVSGADITRAGIFHKTMKLTGFMFAPMFLNILPLFPVKNLYIMPLLTGYWSAWIAYLAMKENYKTTPAGAFIVTLPYLFSVVYGTLVFALKLLT